MKFRNAVVVIILSTLAAGTAAADGAAGKRGKFSNRDVRGIWTYAGWVEATLLVPIPGEITDSTPPSAVIVPGDKITVTGATVGLFKFNGKGAIVRFRDLFKAGGVEPMSPPFPLPFLPPAPEQGHGTYSVAPDGTVQMNTVIVDPESGNTLGEVAYDCVMSRLPRRLDCIFSRFKTFVVDPAGFEAPIVGQITLRPQR